MADKKISALPAATLPLAGTEVLPIVQGGTTDKVAVDDLTVRNLRANATTGILQVTGPTAGTTRVMTVPDASFTAARTDAAQTFTGDQAVTGRVTSNVADTNPALVANATNGHVRVIPYVDNTSYSTIIAYSAGYAGYGVLSLDGLNLRLCTTGTARLTISNLGDATVNTGNLVMGTAGKGIDFSANTHAAGMTSELLDWYEEGTWTGTLTAATPPTTPITKTGRYTRIGNQITIAIEFDNVDTSGAAGAMEVTGLPFAATAAGYGPVMKSGIGTDVIMAGVYGGLSKVIFSDAATMSTTNIVAAAGVYLRFSATYYV